MGGDAGVAEARLMNDEMNDELRDNSLHYIESRVSCTYAQRRKTFGTIIAHGKYG